MECQEIREQLSAWLDEELDDAAAATLTAHLDKCEACRREWRKLTALESALNNLSAPVPPRLAEKVLDRIRPPRTRKWLQPVALAACLVLGIALGGTMAGTFYAPVVSNGTAPEVANLEVFQDFPQGSLGTVVASYQPDEGNGTPQ